MPLYFYAPLYSGSPEVIRDMEQDDGSFGPTFAGHKLK